MASLNFLQFGLGLLIGISTTAILCDRRLTHILRDLRQQLRGDGDLGDLLQESDRPQTSGTALQSLRLELQQLTTDLHHAVAALNQTTADRNRMEGELAVGRNIQMNLLTLTLPNFPKRKDLTLDAILQPARELGGDFYDFYFFREHSSYLFEQNTFCFCIGDVSGKGVPAALFMAVVKTLLRAQSDLILSPAKILTEVNQALSRDNPDCMFVTLCFCTLNLNTGTLIYTNAGHNPPYIRRQNGSLELMERSHGLPIGVIEEAVYQEGRTTLNYGDLLFSYTDGVTEAMDSASSLFSDERLSALLNSDRYSSPTEAIALVLQAVTDFQGTVEQSDDITMLALQFLGHPESIEKSSEFVIKDEVLSSLREDWQ